MAEMCRKMETEEEKVLPFFSQSLTSEEQAQVASIEGEDFREDLSRVRKIKLCIMLFPSSSPLFSINHSLNPPLSFFINVLFALLFTCRHYTSTPTWITFGNDTTR